MGVCSAIETSSSTRRVRSHSGAPEAAGPAVIEAAVPAEPEAGAAGAASEESPAARVRGALDVV